MRFQGMISAQRWMFCFSSKLNNGASKSFLPMNLLSGPKARRRGQYLIGSR